MMTDAQRAAIRAALTDRVKEAENNPDQARARLIREGFYTERGNLTSQYGGRRTGAR
jgi:hypothetical protein